LAIAQHKLAVGEEPPAVVEAPNQLGKSPISWQRAQSVEEAPNPLGKHQAFTKAFE